MALIDDVKTSLRIKATAYNDEITELIASAKADLVLSGLLEAKVVDTDTLIQRAVKFYCKANFGIDNPDSEKYTAAYESLKTHLCLSTEYTVEAVG